MSSVSFSSFFIRVYVECKIDKMYEKRKPFTLQIGLMMFFCGFTIFGSVHSWIFFILQLDPKEFHLSINPTIPPPRVDSQHP